MDRVRGVRALEARRVARWVARGRVAVGLALGAHLDAGGGLLARVAGTRDAILGVGAAIALAERRHSASWVSMGALADAADAWWCLTSPGLGARARLGGVVAAVSAVAGIVTARRLAEEEGDLEPASAVGVVG